MLKPLLFILFIVIISSLVLNFDLFSDSIATPKTVEKSISNINVKTPIKKTIISENNLTVTQEDNLSKELQALLNQADTLFIESKDAQALLLYEKIIKKSKNSKDIKVLQIFTLACFHKAQLHYIYPSSEIDLAIESYELVIKKFKNQQNKELLLAYMQAKTQQARLISREEMIVAIDEVIEKFRKDKEQRFDKEIEELLFEKSFALMGIDDDEAMEALDSIIEKYDDKSKIPSIVRTSILNNIELSIITANDSEKYVDLAEKYLANNPETKPLLDMLNIINNAQELDQSEALEKWNEEHNEYQFPDWSFSELRRWTNKMETPEAQARIGRYLDAFEKQKYIQSISPTVPVNRTYTDENKKNNLNARRFTQNIQRRNK